MQLSLPLKQTLTKATRGRQYSITTITNHPSRCTLSNLAKLRSNVTVGKWPDFLATSDTRQSEISMAERTREAVAQALIGGCIWAADAVAIIYSDGIRRRSVSIPSHRSAPSTANPVPMAKAAVQCPAPDR